MKIPIPPAEKINIDNNSPVYTLGVAAQLADTPAHSIRQYIDMGLLLPFKLESKRHLFSRNDIERLKLIKKLIRDKGLNFSGVRALMAMIPCWAIRECSEEDRTMCDAYADNFQPCWEASKKGRLCKNMNCRECEVYNALNGESGIRSTLRQLL